MRAFAEVTKPDDVEVTVTMTMTISEWKRLRGQFAKAYEWPASDLVDAIDTATRDIEKREIFLPKEPA